MAKDNLFLGQARGSIGDVVFYRMGGQQVSRARNRHPRNPQSNLQLLQRIVAITASRAYSLMIPIVDHSFQYKQVGTGNQSEFMRQNVAMLRDKLADIIVNPTDEMIDTSAAHNFSYPSESMPVVNEYIVSAGSLPSLDMRAPAAGEDWRVWCPVGNNLDPTYAEVCAALGLQAGDQLTFITATHDFMNPFGALYNGFDYARVILSPASGDMNAKFLSAGGVNDPNPRNEGIVNLEIAASSSVQYLQWNRINDCPLARTESPRGMAACAVIVSRMGTTDWLRSSEHLILCAEAAELNSHTIGEAVSELKHAVPSSTLYLNQANVASPSGVGLQLLEIDGGSYCVGSNGRIPVGISSPSDARPFTAASYSDGEGILATLTSEQVAGIIAAGYTFDVLMSGVNSESQALCEAIGNYFTPPIRVLTA